jgi:hypothetical protein
MLKIQSSSNGQLIFTFAGRMNTEHVPKMEAQLAKMEHFSNPKLVLLVGNME